MINYDPFHINGSGTYINLNNVSYIKQLINNKFDIIFNTEIKVDTPEGVRIKHQMKTLELTEYDVHRFERFKSKQWLIINKPTTYIINKERINSIETNDSLNTIKIYVNVVETSYINNELCTMPISIEIDLDDHREEYKKIIKQIFG